MLTLKLLVYQALACWFANLNMFGEEVKGFLRKQEFVTMSLAGNEGLPMGQLFSMNGT